MSNTLAIAGVTNALVTLLKTGKTTFDTLKSNLDPAPTASLEVLSVMPKEAERRLGDPNAQNFVNLFLYRSAPNGAWRNQPLPDRVRPGESGKPPLALDLQYLVTAYGVGGEETISQLALGIAMLTLHDHPVLTRDELAASYKGASLVHEQIEQIKISLRPLNDDELNKLWTSFGAAYRLSAAYDVSAALIESELPIKTPLPVLRRGQSAKLSTEQVVAGRRDVERIFIHVGPSTTTLPTLRSLKPPYDAQHEIRIGEKIEFHGVNLGPEHVSAPQLVFEHSRGITNKFQLTDADRRPTQFSFELPADTPGAPMPAGVWSIHVEYFVPLADGAAPNVPPLTLRTNSLPLTLAPRVKIVGDAPADRTVTIECSPHVVPGQRVSLLLDSIELPYLVPPEQDEPANQLKFGYGESQLPKKSYHFRLRVDGIDSFLIDFEHPNKFDENLIKELPSS